MNSYRILVQKYQRVAVWKPVSDMGGITLSWMRYVVLMELNIEIMFLLCDSLLRTGR